MAEVVRIDKFLWAIRAFKTRTDAAEACKGGKVKIGQVNAKPARDVQAGDIIQVHKGPVVYTYKVVQPTEHRVGAALVPQFAENLTPVETFFVTRERGAGRPTKKDRREMEKLWDAFD